MSLDGPVRRWKTGDILHAENDILRMAYVVTRDPEKVGTLGWHGPDQICVEYISPQSGSLWETGEGTEMDRRLTWQR